LFSIVDSIDQKLQLVLGSFMIKHLLISMKLSEVNMRHFYFYPTITLFSHRKLIINLFANAVIKLFFLLVLIRRLVMLVCELLRLVAPLILIIGPLLHFHKLLNLILRHLRHLRHVYKLVFGSLDLLLTKQLNLRRNTTLHQPNRRVHVRNYA